MKKRIVTLLMACVLVLGTSTTVLAAPSIVVNNSPVVDNTQTQVPVAPEASPLPSEEVKAELSKIEDAKEAREYLVSLPTEKLATTIKEDAALLKQVAEIEDAYTTEKNIQVRPQTTGNAAFAVSHLSVVGAGLNATDTNSTIDLVVGDVAALETVPATYANAVQLDIKLFVNNTSKSDLDVPVAITMNVPGELSTENLVVLHFHNNTISEIVPVVNADGTITFAVDGFSTFAFANKTATTADASYLYYLMANPYGTGNAVTAPKTGEVANVASVMAVMAMAAAVVVVVRRKVTVK